MAEGWERKKPIKSNNRKKWRNERVKESGPVEIINVHEGPHGDDLLGAAIWALEAEGNLACSKRVQLVPLQSREGLGDLSKLLAQGRIAIGTGGGPLDDHQDPQKRCAAELVIAYLGIKDPALDRIVAYSKLNDQRGRGEFLSFYDLVKAMNRYYPAQDVFQWFIGTFKAILERERQFCEALKEVWEKAAIINVDCRIGVRHLIIVESDLPDAARAARDQIIKGDFSFYLLIVRRTNGHTVFLSDHGVPEVVLRDLAKAVRYEEQSAGGKVTLWGWKELGGDGTRSEVPEWYLDAKGGMLLNGSESAQGVPPTNLSLEMVIELAKLAVSDLPPEGCTDPCPKRQCQYHAFGLSRCCAARTRQR